MRFLNYAVALSVVAALASACAKKANNNVTTTGAGGDVTTSTATSTSSGGGATSTSTGTGGASSSGFGGFNATGGSGGGDVTALIYAHTDLTLFSVDPKQANIVLTQIGDFDCIGGPGQDTSMTDVAVDKSQALFGVSNKAVHPLTIQGTTVHCGAPIALQSGANVKFYGLTFAPEGVLDPMKEVLIAGNTAGELWSIDGQGNLAQRGTLGLVPANDGNGHTYANKGKAWELSGDIVFFANNGNPIGFATVRDCPNPPSTSNCDTIDTLIEIDVAAMKNATKQSVLKSVRGQISTAPGCNDGLAGDYGSMYGIGAWNDKVFGFSRKGNLIEIDTNDGSSCLVQAYAMDKFAGAGVTTLAPIQPPPPK
jgi:hypothetical protein